jgi:hypothetical protein
MSEVTLPEVVAALKESCINSDWWKYVQDDARGSLIFIMENVTVVGRSFRDAFIAEFRYSHALRIATDSNKPFSEPTVLFGAKFPEEFYRSGIAPTKSLLRMADWLEPNEADVHACMILCQQVDVLHRMGILPDETPHSANYLAEFLASTASHQENKEKP